MIYKSKTKRVVKRARLSTRAIDKNVKQKRFNTITLTKGKITVNKRRFPNTKRGFKKAIKLTEK